MMSMVNKILKLKRKRNLISKGVALFTLGAAVGAGISMIREHKREPRLLESGGGPAEVDF